MEEEFSKLRIFDHRFSSLKEMQSFMTYKVVQKSAKIKQFSNHAVHLSIVIESSVKRVYFEHFYSPLSCITKLMHESQGKHHSSVTITHLHML